MSTRPRYTVERNACGFVLRDKQATPGTQILAVLQSELAAQTAAQALNRGLCEQVDSLGRWDCDTMENKVNAKLEAAAASLLKLVK